MRGKKYLPNTKRNHNQTLYETIRQRAWGHNKTVFGSVSLTPRFVKSARMPYIYTRVGAAKAS